MKTQRASKKVFELPYDNSTVELIIIESLSILLKIPFNSKQTAAFCEWSRVPFQRNDIYINRWSDTRDHMITNGKIIFAKGSNLKSFVFLSDCKKVARRFPARRNSKKILVRDLWIHPIFLVLFLPALLLFVTCLFEAKIGGGFGKQFQAFYSQLFHCFFSRTTRQLEFHK